MCFFISESHHYHARPSFSAFFARVVFSLSFFLKSLEKSIGSKNGLKSQWKKPPRLGGGEKINRISSLFLAVSKNEASRSPHALKNLSILLCSNQCERDSIYKHDSDESRVKFCLDFSRNAMHRWKGLFLKNPSDDTSDACKHSSRPMMHSPSGEKYTWFIFQYASTPLNKMQKTPFLLSPDQKCSTEFRFQI